MWHIENYEERVGWGTSYTRNFSHALKSGLVVIVANPGPDEEKFTVHKDVLCSQSGYFEGLFNGGFKESGKQEVELHDIVLETFSAVLYWCYHQQVPGAGGDYWELNGDPIVYLVSLWLEADRLLLPSMQDAVMRELCRLLQIHGYMSDRVIHDIYNNTAPGSMLRKLACYYAAYDALCRDRYSTGGGTEDGKRFEELDNFGLDVWAATRAIIRLAGCECVTRKAALDVGFFCGVSNKAYDNGFDWPSNEAQE